MDDRMMVLAGPASARLSAEVSEILRVAPAAYECHRFPDGEMQVEIQESVRGRDVFLLQSTDPPIEQHLMELLLLGDACRRAGAGRLTAVIPYLGYARQDRRTGRRSLGARVQVTFRGFAHSDALETVIQERVAWLEQFYSPPGTPRTFCTTCWAPMRPSPKPSRTRSRPNGSTGIRTSSWMSAARTSSSSS